MQEQGLAQVYYWISVLTFNLFLWEWLLFPREQADLGVRPGLVGHKHPHTDLGVMERQNMVNIHDKSPVRQVFIPPTKHRGETLSWKQASTIIRHECMHNQNHRQTAWPGKTRQFSLLLISGSEICCCKWQLFVYSCCYLVKHLKQIKPYNYSSKNSPLHMV